MFYCGDDVVKKELVNINVKVPKTLKEMMEKYLKCDMHTNISEFTRDALREKIQRDAPDLHKQLFQETPKDEQK
jgi:Arc/MetJ-type ribon-helix-helix transcriptional regulator